MIISLLGLVTIIFFELALVKFLEIDGNLIVLWAPP